MAVKPNVWTRRGLVKPTFDLMGVTDLRQFLQGIDPWVQRRLLIRTLSDATKPIVSNAKQNLTNNGSVRTGALRKALGLVIREYPKSGNITAVIGAKKNVYVQGASGKARRIRKGDKGDAVLKPYKYSHLVEFGHYSAAATGQSVSEGTKGTKRQKGTFPTRSFIGGKPFLRPAFYSGLPFAQARILSGFNEALRREAARMTKKIAKLRKLIAA